MKYPAILHCCCRPDAVLNGKYATQGAADQAVELFRAIHGKVDCAVISGLPPRAKGDGTVKGSAKSRKHGLAYDDDEYHAR